MLRITRTTVENEVVLKLEGKLLAPWKDEVRRACADLTATNPQRRLDLASVSFVDSTGLELLRELLAEGFTLCGCSSFVAELLQVEKPHA